MAEEKVERNTYKAVGGGWYEHSITQQLGSRSEREDGTKVEPKSVVLTFYAHGDESIPQNSVNWLTWMAETVYPAVKAGGMITLPYSNEKVSAVEYAADEYDSKLYGQNLKRRSKNKTGAGAPPVVSIPGDQFVNLVTGEILGKDGKTPVAGAPAQPLAERVLRLNAAIMHVGSRKLPGAFLTAIDALTEAGLITVSGNVVSVAKGNGRK